MNNFKKNKMIIFLVGFPRSGTTLLREILNNHSKIEFLSEETGFIPYVINEIGIDVHFNYDTRKNIYHLFRKTIFFKRMKSKGLYFEPEIFCHNNELNTWDKVFEYIFEFFLSDKEVHIIGEKTPLYLNNMRLLKAIFPHAKFIHIIRDPRDVVLSMKKKWHRSIMRTAARWEESIKNARDIGLELGNQVYFEVYYEIFIQNPERCTENICSFLNCIFENEMLQLKYPISSGGSLIDSTVISASNKNKYTHYFSKKQIRKIEETCYDQLIQLPYNLLYAKKEKKVKPTIYRMLWLYDIIGMTYSLAAEFGIIHSINEMISKYRESTHSR